VAVDDVDVGGSVVVGGANGRGPMVVGVVGDGCAVVAGARVVVVAAVVVDVVFVVVVRGFVVVDVVSTTGMGSAALDGTVRTAR
jgi:hypothetical protein